MTAYAEPKARTVTGAESEFDRVENAIPRPEIRITQTNRGSNNPLIYIIAVLVLAVGGYLLSTYNWSSTETVPTVIQNNTTLPAPDTITPVPLTPPATVPPAPATGTTVQ